MFKHRLIPFPELYQMYYKINAPVSAHPNPHTACSQVRRALLNIRSLSSHVHMWLFVQDKTGPMQSNASQLILWGGTEHQIGSTDK